MFSHCDDLLKVNIWHLYVIKSGDVFVERLGTFIQLYHLTMPTPRMDGSRTGTEKAPQEEQSPACHRHKKLTSILSTGEVKLQL